jgi:predicted CXXCH cytochrome family protein
MDQRRRAGILKRSTVWLAGGGVALGLFLLTFWPSCVQAQAHSPAPDVACKLCHVGNSEQYVFPSGETMPLGVELEPLSDSVHGAHAAEEVYCTDCHRSQERYLYPHQPNPAQNLREFRAEIAENCEQCHLPLEHHNPGHLQARPSTHVPNCVDCHGGHAVEPAEMLNADPIGMCQNCHQTYDDAHVQEVHEEIVANMAPDQNCQSCHSDQPLAEDAKCKTCHSLLTSQIALPSGESVDLHVMPGMIEGSVHGDRQVDGVQYKSLQCTDCHHDQERYGFPHPEIDVVSQRGLTIEMEQICQECHQEIYQAQRDSVHAHALARGDLEAATCADCHGNHDIHDPDEPRERVSQTCAKCHSTINEQYAHSVHGAALLSENNPDVPVCTDCHGVHNIPDPTTAEFRVHSPDLCAGCHADEELMAKYNISTDVFDTYVADFHGTTVELFEKQAPWQETNKAVCYDCHGIHNILPVDDEHSQVVKENLLTTCRQCHPDANTNFPDAWTSHFEPSPENNSLVYLVNLFYFIVIPLTVGGFVLFIGTDVYRRFMRRLQDRKDNGQ